MKHGRACPRHGSIYIVYYKVYTEWLFYYLNTSYLEKYKHFGKLFSRKLLVLWYFWVPIILVIVPTIGVSRY